MQKVLVTLLIIAIVAAILFGVNAAVFFALLFVWPAYPLSYLQTLVASLLVSYVGGLFNGSSLAKQSK